MTGWMLGPGSTLVVVAAAGAAIAGEFCAVTGFEGTDASVERAGTTAELALGPLAATDGTIRTGQGTRLQVTCDGGTVVTIGPESQVNLSELMAEAEDRPSVVVRLLEGIAGFVSPEPARTAFAVETPVAVAAVRTTEWLVEHDGATDASAVFVRRGEVAVSNVAGSFVLQPGEGITIGRDAVVRPVARWGQPRIAQSTGALGFAWD